MLTLFVCFVNAGNILGMLQIDMTKALAYIATKRRETGARITVRAGGCGKALETRSCVCVCCTCLQVTHLVIKAVALALRAVPSLNGRLVLGE